ncbi:FxsA family protein [Streptomyces sodiiphilus]|uniref:FxsA family protein n=2 Tax=Streptomyces sodiiphilus TaxID=226217 RepID=A0ABN2NQ51_9ACTN
MGFGIAPTVVAAGRARALLPLLPLVLAAFALLELWLLLALGRAAGGLTVFLVLVAGLVSGVLAVKRGGRAAWRRLGDAVRSAQEGRKEPMERRRGGGHALTILGGLLLILPGLVSDAVGLLLLFPPTAALLRRGGRRFLIARSGPLGAAYEEARAAHEQIRIRRPDGKVVPGEVVDEERPGGRGPEAGEDEDPRPPRRDS